MGLTLLLTTTAACDGTTSNAELAAEARRTATTTSTVMIEATTTTLKPLRTDPRITPSARLDLADLCKIRQVSTNYSPFSTTGFPRSPGAGDPTRNLRVLIAPLEAADAPFTADDRSLLELISVQASDYFAHESYGRVRLDVTWIDPPITFPMTVSELGWDAPGRIDRREMISAARNQLREQDLSDVDVVSFFAPADNRYHFGVASPLPDETTGGFTLNTFIGGTRINTWTTFAHELIHVWLGSADLYDFSDKAVTFMGHWDIMAADRGNVEMNAWIRWLNGWIVDTQVRCVDIAGSNVDQSIHFLAPLSEASNDPKMVVVRLTDHSALVIDSRRTITFGVDSWDSDSEVALVYMVDAAIDNGAGPIRLRGELRTIGQTLSTDGVTITLIDTRADGDLVTVAVD